MEATSTALGWYPSHLVMQAIDGIHTFTGVPYWEAIVCFTLAFRVVVLPLSITTAQGSARMAAVRPHLQKLSDRIKSNPNSDSRSTQQMALESRALMKQYKVNPFTALAMPFVQLPIFMSCFFGLQAMATHFPGYATGGTLWFVDLSAADPYLILPAANALSFLLMIELGADGLQTGDQDTFKWVMRGLAVAMTPLTMSMSQGLFVYWSTNNVFSIAQALFLRNEAVRKYLDIPKPPLNAAPLKMSNPITRLQEAWKKERLVGERAKAEVVDGAKAFTPTTPAIKPAVTFAQPPKKKREKAV